MGPLKAGISQDRFLDTLPGKATKSCGEEGTSRTLEGLAEAASTAALAGEKFDTAVRKAISTRRQNKRKIASVKRQIKNRARRGRGPAQKAKKLAKLLKDTEIPEKDAFKEGIKKEVEEALKKAGKLQKILKGGAFGAAAGALVGLLIKAGERYLEGGAFDEEFLKELAAEVAKAGVEGFISGAVAAAIVAALAVEGLPAFAIGVFVSFLVGLISDFISKGPSGEGG